MKRKLLSHEQINRNTVEVRLYRLLLALILGSIVIISGINSCYGQAPVVEWQKGYGDQYPDGFNAVYQTTDGGYIIAGDKGQTSPMMNYTYWVKKVDATGANIWERILGGSKGDIATTILQTIDGGYVVGGHITSGNGDVTGRHGIIQGFSDIWILKLDATGNVLWKKCYGGDGSDSCSKIVQLADGSLVVAGTTNSTNGDLTGHINATGKDDVWVLKLDAQGNIGWEQTYGGTKEDDAFDIIAMQDGSFVIAGRSASQDGNVSHNAGMYDVWLLRISSTGNLLWEKSFGGSRNEIASSIIATHDGGFMVAATTHSDDGDISGLIGGFVGGVYLTDVWILKLDNNGNKQWAKVLGGSYNDRAYSIARQNNNYVVASQTGSEDGDISAPIGGFDIWLTALDMQGNLQWDKCIGGILHDGAPSFHEYGMHIINTSDGGLAVAGMSNSVEVNGNSGGQTQGALFKLGNIVCDTSIQVHDTLVCMAELGSLILSASSNGSTYTWNTGSTTAAIEITTTGTYWRVTSKGCSLLVDTFHVNSSRTKLFHKQDTVVCPEARIILSGNDDFEQYIWNTGAVTPSIAIQQEGIFWRVAENQCYTVTDTFTVAFKERLIKPELGSNVEWCKESKKEIGVEQGNLLYSWNTGETTSRIIPGETGVFVLSVDNGCEALQDSIYVQLYNCDDCLFIPSAFTPNGDGLNDGLRIIAKCPVTQFKIEIFNRWGECVFLSSDIERKWNGVYKGMPMPVGVYYYHMLWQDKEGNKRYAKGDITLIH